MLFKKIKLICLIIGMLVVGYSIGVFAHPPSDMALDYDFENQILDVTITHVTLDENSHYIYKVEIEKNDVTMITEEYENQPTKDTFTYSYDIEANTGDKLTVTAFCSLYGSLAKTLTVAGDNNPPTRPQISGPADGETGISYTYTAESTDPDGEDIVYCFEWGDGTSYCTEATASGQQVNAPHTWQENGNYVITVTATDTQGLSSEPATLRVSMPLTNTIKHWSYVLMEKIIVWLLQINNIQVGIQ
jgi:hypothetical protein